MRSYCSRCFVKFQFNLDHAANICPRCLPDLSVEIETVQASSARHQGRAIAFAVDQTGDRDEPAFLENLSSLRRRIHAGIDFYFVDLSGKGRAFIK
jgi:hypothetical protein